MSKSKPDAKEREAHVRAGPRKTTGGNNRPDQEWIAEMQAAGELQQPDWDSKPSDCFFDPLIQWTGYADEVSEEFFEWFRRPNARKCTGDAYVRDQRGGYVVDIEWERIKRPCLRNPIKGGTVCPAHGGRIPAVKAAAERALANAAEMVAHRLIGLTAPTDENREAIEHKTRLAAMNSVLDRAGIKGGVSVEIVTPGYQKVLADMFSADDEPETPDGE